MLARLGVTVCMAALAAAVASAAPATQRSSVLVIGDSVATGMYWNTDAIAVMQKNLDLVWDIAVCRTIGGVSCPYEGKRAPTLLDAVASRGTVPPTVVVIVGYNDPEETFSAEVDEAMSALVAAGARTVLWLTLFESQPQYHPMNMLLARAEERWPQLVLVDWNAAAQNQPWLFQSDEVHLKRTGGLVMSHLVHGAVTQILDPLRVRGPLWLRVGRATAMRLHAHGGTPPYRWRVASGRPPRGFRLLADGTLTTAARKGPSASLVLSVSDADGITAYLPVVER